MRLLIVINHSSWSVETVERGEKRSIALQKAQHDEELKKIQTFAKQRIIEEKYKEVQVMLTAFFCFLFDKYVPTVSCHAQEKRAQSQQIKYEIEVLKRKVGSRVIDMQKKKI